MDDTAWNHSEAHEASPDGPGGSSPKPSDQQPQKRKAVSERRRLQNRHAQKNYRERQKMRLRALEDLVQRRMNENTPPSLFGTSGTVALDVCRTDDSSFQELLLDEPAGQLIGSGDFEWSEILTGDPSLSSDFYSSQIGHLPRRTSGPTNQDISNIVSETLSSEIPPSRSGDISRPNPPATASTWMNSTNDPGRNLLSSFLSQSDGLITTDMVRRITESRITLQDILRLGLGELQRTLHYSRLSTKQQVFHNQLNRQNVRKDDSNLNLIRLTQVTFLSACLQNAAMLGLTPATASHDDAESPFFSESARLEDMDQVQKGFGHLKIDLRPTKNQLSRRHHPYLDVLPFPTFRERTIALLNVDPPIIDEDELCHDLLNDGLVCWGSAPVVGSTGSGMPWDIRSWEARPWFLKKWWFLTGGVEGEMYAQTRWWCEMRGDRVPRGW